MALDLQFRREDRQMAAVRSVVNFHVRPGKYSQLFEVLKTIKKIVERAGGTLIVNREVFGPQPGNVVAVGQYPDWGTFAKFRSDAELEQFLERMRSNTDPPADVVASAVFEEVAL
jgi:hypothetical protein